eukprot:530588-Amphidinium_carterae.1
MRFASPHSRIAFLGAMNSRNSWAASSVQRRRLRCAYSIALANDCPSKFMRSGLGKLSATCVRLPDHLLPAGRCPNGVPGRSGHMC